MNVVDETKADPTLRKTLGNPYALAPEGMRSGPKQPNVTVPAQDSASGQWVAPFVMAGINTKVVHRSHALLERPWGDGFLYDEAMLMGEGPLGALKAGGLVAGLGGFMGLAAVGPARPLLERVLPKPGEGPSPEEQKAGFFDLRFYGTTARRSRPRSPAIAIPAMARPPRCWLKVRPHCWGRTGVRRPASRAASGRHRLPWAMR